MIQHSPSVVAIDDRPEELNAIVNALRLLDIACLPILVDGIKPNIAKPLTGVRLVFFDINYLPAGLSETAMYEVAATVLTSVLAPENGPYMLVTWSSKSDHHDALMAHFASKVDDLPTPAMSACLPKEKFLTAGTPSAAAASTGAEAHPEQLNVNQQVTSARPDDSASQVGESTKPVQSESHAPSTGETVNSAQVGNETGSGDGTSLRDEIKSKLTEHPQLEALMHWELAVRRASGDVVNSILDLFPRKDRFEKSCGPRLETVLTHMAGAAVGKKNVASNRQAAISEALTPILYDRLTHLPPSLDEAALWSRAIPLGDDIQRPLAEQTAKLNALSLIAFPAPGQEVAEAGDRGAVFQLAGGVAEYFIQRTGISKIDLMHEFLEVWAGEKSVAPAETDLTEEFRWVLIGTRATCDQAQRRGTNISPAVLALEVPDKLKYGKQQKNGLRIREHGAAMLTPFFSCRTSDGQSGKIKRLVLNWHWVVSLMPNELAGAGVLYRLREPLINQVCSTKSGYQARPGIVSFT
jgi:hypothetical protein